MTYIFNLEIIFCHLWKKINKVIFRDKMCDKIIPLGSNCGITLILQNLKIKKETSLFEWFRSRSLNGINKVIQHIYENGINDNIIGKCGACGEIGKGVSFFGDKTYYDCVESYHYNLNEYKKIYIRRAERFIDSIKNEKSILFIRIDNESRPTTKEEVNEFINLIKSMNPHLDFTFLLVSCIIHEINFVPIDIKNNFINKFILQSDYKNIYFTENNHLVDNKIKQMLIDVGYNCDSLIDIEFTDKSEI